MKWQVRAPDMMDAERVRWLAAETALSPLTVRVCLARGLADAESIESFLEPKIEGLTNPSTIKDMNLAVERLSRARAGREHVRIFGDYDVDGTTGAALLSWVFRDFGMVFDARQPDRFKDGYGLNVRAVDEAADEGVRVLVTVDCGITSFDAAERAAERGIDLIIVDHHQIDPERGLPRAHAVVNPQRADCPSGLRQLCGCGLAFYLAIALRAHEKLEINLKQHLDLVVIATAADQVPLTGDNRILVRHGMGILQNSRKPGVRALLEVAGIARQEVSPGHLGFVLGPRINASGRISSASLALELLTTTDVGQATRRANEIELLNKERSELQNRIWDEVRARVEQGLAQGRFTHGIVVADPGWHEGVVGIVASKVTETFKRPAAVIALREDFGKGSVRSYAGKDVLAALRASSRYLLGFGGHRYAAGLSLAPENLDAFTAAFDEALGLIEVAESQYSLMIEGECVLEELDVKTLRELERLAPFGPGNPEPVFSVQAEIRTRQILKGRHLKLNLGAPGGTMRGPQIEAIWFNAAENEDLLTASEGTTLTQWAGVPELNRFRGRTTPTLRVRDVKR